MAVEVKGADGIHVRDNDDDRKEPKKFSFTQVYAPNSTQEEVFKDCESLMTSVLDGFNVCIFAYGQSGSGKTHTMEGSADLPGLAPRAMTRLFEVWAPKRRLGSALIDCSSPASVLLPAILRLRIGGSLLSAIALLTHVCKDAKAVAHRCLRRPLS